MRGNQLGHSRNHSDFGGAGRGRAELKSLTHPLQNRFKLDIPSRGKTEEPVVESIIVFHQFCFAEEA
jgi:hypothetical protein